MIPNLGGSAEMFPPKSSSMQGTFSAVGASISRCSYQHAHCKPSQYIRDTPLNRRPWSYAGTWPFRSCEEASATSHGVVLLEGERNVVKSRDMSREGTSSFGVDNLILKTTRLFLAHQCCQ